MSIINRAIELAIEAKNTNHSYFAESILGNIDLSVSDNLFSSQEAVHSFSMDCLRNGLLALAARFIETAISRNLAIDSKVVMAAMHALSRRGDWENFNALFLMFVQKFEPKLKRNLVFHLLEQLDIQRLSEVLTIQVSGDETELRSVRLCFKIVKMEYASAERDLVDDSEILLEILRERRLRKWIFVLMGYREEKFGHFIASYINSQHLASGDLLDGYSDLLKVCWVRGWTNIIKNLITSSHELADIETIRSNLVFSRVYCHSCIKLSLYNNLYQEICDPANGVFTSEELWAIRFEENLLDKKISEALRIEFGDYAVSSDQYLELPLIIYGDEYIDAFQKTFLASALASHDFCALPKSYKAVISICTTPQTVSRLRILLEPLAKIGFTIRFDGAIFSENDIPHRRMWFYVSSLQRVENCGGVLLLMCPDSLFGDGLLELIKKCPDGGGAGGSLFRASWSRIMESVESGELQSVLHSPRKNKLLAEFGTSRWKHYSQRLFFENISPNFVNKVVSGRRFNNWQGIPNVLKPQLGLTKKLLQETIYRYSNVFGDHVGQYFDHELIPYLCSQDRLYMTNSFREFVFIEMAKDDAYSQLWKFQLPINSWDILPFGQTFTD